MSFPSFIDGLYSQARISQKVVASAFNSKATSVSGSAGTIYIGGYNASKANGPFAQYPVKLNTSYWGYTLTNVQVGNLSLGYNGLLAVDVGTSFTVVPMSLYRLFLQLVFPPNTTFGTVMGNGVQLARFACNDTTYSILPNITYYLDGRPFVMAPYQYINRFNSTDCITALGGSLPTYMGPAPFILGIQSLNTTLNVFDIGNRTLSVAPLNLN